MESRLCTFTIFLMSWSCFGLFRANASFGFRFTSNAQRKINVHIQHTHTHTDTSTFENRRHSEEETACLASSASNVPRIKLLMFINKQISLVPEYATHLRQPSSQFTAVNTHTPVQKRKRKTTCRLRLTYKRALSSHPKHTALDCAFYIHRFGGGGAPSLFMNSPENTHTRMPLSCAHAVRRMMFKCTATPEHKKNTAKATTQPPFIHPQRGRRLTHYRVSDSFEDRITQHILSTLSLAWQLAVNHPNWWEMSFRNHSISGSHVCNIWPRFVRDILMWHPNQNFWTCRSIYRIDFSVW